MPLKLQYICKIFIIQFFIFTSVFPAIAKDYVVVIDAGHGGKDMGALGLNSYEKDINLGVALKVGKLIETKMKDIKVVYTRDNDTYLTLQERANIANKANGNVFISIHTNSIDKKNRNRTKIQGSATYTLGLHRTDENLEVAKRENSVIQLEKDYTTAYKGFDPNSTESYIIFEISQRQHMDQSIHLAALIQKEFATSADRVDNGVRQAGFWVLAATSMPAVLVELDFICNPSQEKFLNTEEGRDKLAGAIFNAFNSYKMSVDAKIATVAQAPEQKKTRVEQKKKDDSKGTPIYVKPNYEDNSVADNEINYQYSVRKKEGKTNLPHSKKREKKVKSKQKELEPVIETANSEPIVESSKNEKTKVTFEQNTETVDTKNNKLPKVETTYRVQFLSSEKEITNKKAFKNVYPVACYKESGLYKYTFGETTSISEARRLLNSIKSKFKEAFIVRFIDGKRVNN